MLVKKRNGDLVEFDLAKIRRVIGWACEGLKADPIVLESSVALRFTEGIETRAIQDNLIDTAQSLVLDENGGINRDWTVVAGRLFLYNLNKDVQDYWAEYQEQHGLIYEPDLSDRIQHLCDKGIYNKTLLATLDHDIVNDLWRHAKAVASEDEGQYDIAGARAWAQKYLSVDNKRVVETPTMAIAVISLLLTQGARSNRLLAAIQVFDAISSRKISLATPILANLRKSKGSLTSCFIVQAGDSKDSIFYIVDQLASMSKNGGGVGIEISKIRASMSMVNGIPGASGGVIPWVKIFNDTAVAVNQNGRRAGAATIALRCWHLDILDFLKLQEENGDQRMKAYDIFPQVGIHDLLMERALSGGVWTLLCPFEVKQATGSDIVDMHGATFEAHYKMIESMIADGSYTGRYQQIPAKDLLKQINKTQIETGMPYLAFIDTINRYNPNKDDGMIGAVNLCVESFSNFRPSTPKDHYYNPQTGMIERQIIQGLAHCCNLVSANMANINSLGELGRIIRMCVSILDNTINLTHPPLAEAKLHNDRYRTIGIGLMGWADWLAKNKMSYISKAALLEADKVGEVIAYNALKRSVEIAAISGPFEAYERSEFKKGIYLGKTFAELSEGALGVLWIELGKEVAKYGVRNSHLTAIAPNTSSSLIQGCTASFLPAYGKLTYDASGKQTSPICPPYVGDAFWYYNENKNVDQSHVINMTAALQKWIDTGISMELLYNLNSLDENGEELVTGRYIRDMTVAAWKQGVKAIYYTRSVQRGQTDLEGRDSGCVSCAN